MELKIKTFAELNTKDLYRILKARAEIFVVEQNCVYQDLDDVDFRSLHFYYESEEAAEAYLRVFEGDAGTVRIGRVLTLHHGNGLGGRILKESLKYIREEMKPERIYIEAQCYAKGYYEKEGFRTCTEEFLEDGIPHVGMEIIL